MKHNHHHCQHVLAYCDHCDTAYCTRCDAEWKKPCTLNHFFIGHSERTYRPWTPNPWQPTWIYGSGAGAGGTLSGISVSNHTAAQQTAGLVATAERPPDDDPPAVTCRHGR